MPERDGTAARGFSAIEARPLIADLFTPRPFIYWTDFLASILGGHVCFWLVRLVPLLLPGLPWVSRPLQVLAFVASCLLYYRSAMFIHELVHFKRGTFRGFRIAWNLLCGIPLLIPSFVYYPHLEHHRRTRYGTHEDGEYLPLAHSSPWMIPAYFVRPFVVPPLVLIRFVLFTPLAWLVPAFRRWVYRHASSLVVNPGYLRPPPLRGAMVVMRVQEAACFCWCVGVVVVSLVLVRRLPLPFLLHGYVTAVGVLFLSGFRTLGQHRWGGQGEQMTLEEQLLDSANYPHWPLFSELWGPIGLRFHALHHVYPTLPYYALPEAHRRLMKHLPADSPYRRTEEPTLLAALATLWGRARRADKSHGRGAGGRVV
jgi:fatty acid desaturase